MTVRVRFAPSPTGKPHVGNIRTAIFNWLYARHHGGKFILRIEDTDRERYSPDALKNLLETLRWLKLDWDEGPEVGGEYGPYFQSERLDIYHRYAQELVDNGYAYYCTCSKERLDRIRKEAEAKGLPPRYDRHCRELGIKGSPTDTDKVIRFKIPLEGTTTFHDEIRGDITFENENLDDFVILKSDGFPTYHFANIIDDHLMKITDVMRAEEWIPSTGKHILMYRAFGWEPPRFCHLPMILGADRSKLSKRHGAVDALEYRNMGILPEALFNFLTLIGWSPGTEQEIFSIEELIELFDKDGINPASGVFNLDKLIWMNSEYIHKMDDKMLLEKLLPIIRQRGWSGFSKEYLMRIVSLMKTRMRLLNDLVELAPYFFEEPTQYDEKGVRKHFKKEGAKKRLNLILHAFDKLSDFNEETTEKVIRTLAEETGTAAKFFIHPLRLAVTGMTFGPGLFEILATLGKQRCISRIKRAVEFIEKGCKMS
ncbi:glutamate--tRNA ligase [bacterium]|nr:glutamate--tRNA ligase [bacterium]